MLLVLVESVVVGLVVVALVVHIGSWHKWCASSLPLKQFITPSHFLERGMHFGFINKSAGSYTMHSNWKSGSQGCAPKKNLIYSKLWSKSGININLQLISYLYSIIRSNDFFSIDNYKDFHLRPFHLEKIQFDSQSFHHTVNLHWYIFQVSTMSLMHLLGLQCCSCHQCSEIDP